MCAREGYGSGQPPARAAATRSAVLELAKERAGPDKDVALHGGSPLQHGVLDEMVTRLVPFLLGAGRPLFGETGIDPLWLEQLEATMTPQATYLHYRVPR